MTPADTDLTLAGLTGDPDRLTAALRAGDGTSFTARLLRADDAEPLGRYLDGLSDAVRGVYAPHPLTAAHARVLCAQLDYEELLPFLAWVDGGLEAGHDAGHDEHVVAYFLLRPGLRDGDRQRYVDHGHPLVAAGCCTFAPCVADAWQTRGLGSALMGHVTASLRRLGFRRVVLMGGVRADNPRAQHFYRKAGFRHVGDFETAVVNNHDMVLDL